MMKWFPRLNRSFVTEQSRRMDATIDQCWKALLDIEAYPRWQQAIMDAKITRSEGGRPLEAVFELNALIRPVQYTLAYTYPREQNNSGTMVVHWHSTAGELKRIEGGCRLRSTKNGQTDTMLWFDVVPGIPVPRHIRKVLQTVALDQALKDFEAHARSFA